MLLPRRPASLWAYLCIWPGAVLAISRHSSAALKQTLTVDNGAQWPENGNAVCHALETAELQNDRVGALIYRKRRIPVGTLRNLIAELAGKGHPSIGQAAAHLGLSARSLQRQLEHQGITYSDLVEDTRQEIARGLLHDTTLNIAQVAAMLGYRDPSSFSRAFARWAGCSPRRYRAATREGDRASG